MVNFSILNKYPNLLFNYHKLEAILSVADEVMCLTQNSDVSGPLE